MTETTVPPAASDRVAAHLRAAILGGEIRPVSQSERRLAEAAKMGMTTAYISERGVPRRTPTGLRAVGVRTVGDLFGPLFR